MEIIVGDIGATNARLAVARWRNGLVELRDVQYFSSTEHSSFAPLLKAYFRRHPADHVASIAVPGPVVDGHCQVTNLPWVLNARILEREVGLEHCWLLNDLEAAAWGLEDLDEDDTVTLQEGEPHKRGAQVVIAAGTGLGQAARIWCETGYCAHASEGGHADFAPSDEREFALAQWLAEQVGHVSWDRLVCGSGLRLIFDFLLDDSGRALPATLEQAFAEDDPPAVITRAALSGNDALCEQAVDLFLRLLGAEAGNLALKYNATGGVYIGGGIPPRLSGRMASSGLIDRFNDKGRINHLTKRMPVKLITDGTIGMKGAATFAADRVDPWRPIRLTPIP